MLTFCNTLLYRHALLFYISTKCKKCLEVANKLIHTVPVIYDYEVRKASHNLRVVFMDVPVVS
jgi:phage FluMu protein Com